MARETQTTAVPESDRHLLPEFNAAAEKVAVLRGLLLEHRVDYNPSAKKAELVRLFNQHVKPRAAQLLAERQAVESSSHGIERVSSQAQGTKAKGKRRREEVPEPEPEDDELASTSDGSSPPPTQSLPKVRGRQKQVSTTNQGTAASIGGAKRKIKAEPEVEVLPTAQNEEEIFPRKLKRSSNSPDKKPKSEELEKGLEETRPSPKKKPRVTYHGEGSGSMASAEPTPQKQKRRKSAQLPARDSPSGFSDYNPFQSGGDPSERKKGRKSSANPVELDSPAVRASASASNLALPSKPDFRPSSPLNPAFVSPDKVQVEAQAKLDELRRQQYALHQQREAQIAAAQEQHRQQQSLPRSASTPAIPRRSAAGSRPRQSLSAILKQAEEDEKSLIAAADQLEEEIDRHQPVADAWSSYDQSPDNSMEAPRRRSTGTPARKQVAHRVRRPSRAVRQPSEEHEEEENPGEQPFEAPDTEQVALEAPRALEQQRHQPSRPAPLKATSFPATAKRTPLKVHHKHRAKSFFSLSSILSYLLRVAFVSYFLYWRHQRLHLGYCDTGTNSQRVLEEPGNAFEPQDQQQQQESVALISSLIDRATPACMPCPAHATCAFGKLISCDTDYVRKSSPWSSRIVPLADRCVPDTEKLARIIELAAATNRKLRQEHGRVLCKSSSAVTHIGNVAQIGLKRSRLAELMQPEAVKIPEHLFAHYFAQAVEDLVQGGEAVRTKDAGGTEWIASTVADMSLGCRMRRSAYAAAARHKAFLSQVLAVLFAVWWLRSWYRQHQQEKARVRDLVNSALRLLRDQKLRHLLAKDEGRSTSDIPAHWGLEMMRDQLLSSVHNLAKRQRLWNKVAQVVESNDNIALKSVVQHGQPLTVWEWTGNTDARLDLDGSPKKPEVESIYPSLE